MKRLFINKCIFLFSFSSCEDWNTQGMFVSWDSQKIFVTNGTFIVWLVISTQFILEILKFLIIQVQYKEHEANK